MTGDVGKPLDQPPQISTVMLCWNRKNLSPRCLESYLEHTKVPYQLIIVDNGSTDGNTEWARSLEDDSRISKVICRQQNQSADALNEALAYCTAPLLHVMEQDFLYLPDWDRYVLDRFQRVPKLGLLGLATPAEGHRGKHLFDAVYEARPNVTTTSVFPRDLFFEHGMRWQYCSSFKKAPGDFKFSQGVLDLGMIVAFADQELTVSLGFQDEEFAANPDYYLETYWNRVVKSGMLRVLLRKTLRGKFRETHFLRKDLYRLIRILYYRERARWLD